MAHCISKSQSVGSYSYMIRLLFTLASIYKIELSVHLDEGTGVVNFGSSNVGFLYIILQSMPRFF